jgi:hypothetical protein
MRKLGVAALAALLCAGFAASEAGAGDTDSDAAAPAKSSWWPGSWFAAKPKQEEKIHVGKVEDDGERTPDRTLVMRQELEALNRRQAVCLRLQEIAAETHDTELQHKAEQMDAQAFRIYLQRTGAAGSRVGFETAESFTESKPKAKKSRQADAGEDK